MCSIYEFIYSCRDTADSSFPNLKSKTAENALELLKRMKNSIAQGRK